MRLAGREGIAICIGTHLCVGRQKGATPPEADVMNGNNDAQKRVNANGAQLKEKNEILGISKNKKVGG
jgi:hypothetical protein